MDAMKQYQAYTALIAPSKAEKDYRRRLNTLRSQSNPVQMMERLRRQSAAQMILQ